MANYSKTEVVEPTSLANDSEIAAAAIANEPSDSNTQSNPPTPSENGSIPMTATIEAVTTPPDPFDVSALRLKGNIADDSGTRKILAHVRVGKPDKQTFFRVNPDPDRRIVMAILELKEENETYAVAPEIAEQLSGEIKRVEIRLCVTNQGVSFLWPVPMPSSDGRENPWYKTARLAAEHAETDWVRMFANRGAGSYDIKIASPGMPDPAWPIEHLTQLLRIAFGGGKLIDRIDHPVIKRLLGR